VHSQESGLRLEAKGFLFITTIDRPVFSSRTTVPHIDVILRNLACFPQTLFVVVVDEARDTGHVSSARTNVHQFGGSSNVGAPEF